MSFITVMMNNNDSFKVFTASDSLIVEKSLKY